MARIKLNRLSSNFPPTNFTKNPPAMVEVILADGRTDRRGEANRHFSRVSRMSLNKVHDRACRGGGRLIADFWLPGSGFDVMPVHMGFVVGEVTLGRENMCFSLRTQDRLTNYNRGLLCYSLRTGTTAPWPIQRCMTCKLMFFLAFYSLFPWQQVTQEKWVTMSSRWRSSIDNATA